MRITLYENCPFSPDNSDVAREWGAVLSGLDSYSVVINDRVPFTTANIIVKRNPEKPFAVYNYARYHDCNYMPENVDACYFVVQDDADPNNIRLYLTIDPWASAGVSGVTAPTFISGRLVKSHFPIDNAEFVKGWTTITPCYNNLRECVPFQQGDRFLLCITFLIGEHNMPVTYFVDSEDVDELLNISQFINDIDRIKRGTDNYDTVTGIAGVWVIPFISSSMPVDPWVTPIRDCQRKNENGTFETLFYARTTIKSIYQPVYYTTEISGNIPFYMLPNSSHIKKYDAIEVGTPFHRIPIQPVLTTDFVVMPNPVTYKFVAKYSGEFGVQVYFECAGQYVDITDDYAVPYKFNDENAIQLQNEANKNTRMISAGISTAVSVGGAVVMTLATGGAMAPVAAGAIAGAAGNVAGVISQNKADETRAAFAPTHVTATGNAYETYRQTEKGVGLFLYDAINKQQIKDDAIYYGLTTDYSVSQGLSLTPKKGSYTYYLFDNVRINPTGLRSGLAIMLETLFLRGVRVWGANSAFLTGWRS